MEATIVSPFYVPRHMHLESGTVGRQVLDDWCRCEVQTLAGTQAKVRPYGISS